MELLIFFFSSRRRHTRYWRDWSSDVCSSDLKDKAKLRAVLLYHVAKGKLTASKVVKRSSIKTVNGDRVSVRVRSGKAYVGGARVTTADVAASNGVIHVINKVLIPR